jgi:hypothetical protein
MGIRALRPVAAAAALAAAFAVTAGPAVRAYASAKEVVIAATAGSGLEVATQANGSPWHIETVATGLYGQPSVAIESNGIIVIAAVFLTGAYRGTLYYFWQAALCEPGSRRHGLVARLIVRILS